MWKKTRFDKNNQYRKSIIMFLIFEKMEFLKGRNLTIRRGTKWDQRDVNFVSDRDGNKVVTIKNVVRKVMKFSDLTEADLVHEHDSDCRTYHGLLLRMLQLYPDFDEREIVTLIYFEIQGTHPF